MTHSWHSEPHFIKRNNWLRASVLGANDGLISTASLLMGMVSASATQNTLLLAGSAALVAGAISMAAGEYVSVSSQSDSESADLNKERLFLDNFPKEELAELTNIYVGRGLDKKLATEVAKSLMAHDDLDAHAKDELGITDTSKANPLQAAGASALSFILGAIMPILIIILSPTSWILQSLVLSTLLGLATLGYVSAKLGGASILNGVTRVMAWGVLALTATWLIGMIMGVNIN